MFLLAEDNVDDVFFFQRAMQKAKLSFPIHVVENGLKAIEYLQGTGDYQDRARHPMPALVLMDLKLPFASGFEVLAWIRQQLSLARLPVVILTSSPEQRDREMAVKLGASGYLVKPPTPDMLRELFASIEAERIHR